MNHDEEMAILIRAGMGGMRAAFLPQEKVWFFKKAEEFLREGNPDPLGSVVREFQLWPNRSIGESLANSSPKQEEGRIGPDEGASQVLHDVISAVRNFMEPNVTWKEAYWSTYAKGGNHWSIEFKIPTEEFKRDLALTSFVDRLAARVPTARIKYIQIHNIGGWYWAVKVEIPTL